MANVNVTPNMGLPNPVPGVDPGPDYANNLQSCFNILDQHNHSNANGVQINPAGININTPLPFNNNQAQSLQAAIFTPQASFAPLDSIYVKTDGNLYYNDGAGNVVQLTTAGAVNATSSGISSGSATASFSGGVLVVNAASNTPANIQCASILLGNNSSGSNFATLSPPAALGSNYGLVLPLIPAGTSFMTLDSSGNMGATIATAGGITRSNLAPVGQQISSSCGLFFTTSTSFVSVTNLSVTITTSGRPIMLMIQPDGTAGAGIIGVSGNETIGVEFQRGTFAICYSQFSWTSAGSTSSSSMQYLDAQPSGTYTYAVNIKSIGGLSVSLTNSVLVAYEL